MAWHRAILLACLVACTMVHIGSSESAFVSQKLDAAEIEEAQALALRVRDALNKNKETGTPPTDFLKPDEQWYKPIDFEKQPRFNAIGALFFIPVKSRDHKLTKVDGKPQMSYGWKFGEYFDRCSAFYVAPDILATSAHCIRDVGKLTPEGLNRAIFRHQYDSKQDLDAKQVEKHERVIIEWIYASGYEVDESTFKSLIPPRQEEDEGKEKEQKDSNDMEKPGKHHYALDFAFMRTDRQCGDCLPYTLVSPDLIMPKNLVPKKEDQRKKAVNKIKSGKIEITQVITPTDTEAAPVPLVLAGYPVDAFAYFDPAYAQCDLAEANHKTVKEDKGLKRQQAIDPKLLEELRTSQLFCVGKNGNVGTGASGGPWMLDDSSMDKVAMDVGKAVKERWVVGITSWGMTKSIDENVKPGTPEYKKAFRTGQSFTKTMMTPRFQPTFLDIYDQIRKTPKNKRWEYVLNPAKEKEEKAKADAKGKTVKPAANSVS